MDTTAPLFSDYYFLQARIIYLGFVLIPRLSSHSLSCNNVALSDFFFPDVFIEDISGLVPVVKDISYECTVDL